MSDQLDRKNIEKTEIDWNEHAEYWDAYDDAKEYTKNIVRLINDRIDIVNLNILDFGCGTGLLIDQMTKKAAQIVAVDSSEKMINVLESKNYSNVVPINSVLSKDTIDNNPVLSEKFDLIVAVSVCAFLPNYHEVLKNIKSLLKPDGLYIQWDWLRNEKDPNFGFTKEMISTNFKQLGLKVDSINIPFYMMEKDEKMEVLMAIGKL